MAAAVAVVLASTCGADGEQATVDTQPATPTTDLVTTPPLTVDDTAMTTPAPNGLGLVLRHDGLAVVTFGQPVDAVLAVLTGLLGPPDWEEVQISPDVDRTVQWNDPFLHLQFTHWDHFDAATRPSPAPEG